MEKNGYQLNLRNEQFRKVPCCLEELMSPSLTQIKSESSEYATAMNLSGIFGRDFSCDQAFSKSECLTYDKIDDAEDKREQKCAEVMKGQRKFSSFASIVSKAPNVRHPCVLIARKTVLR